MTDGLERRLESELKAGERLLWSGIPRQGIVFRPIDVFLVPFTLLWCAMAIFMFFSAARHAPFPFALMPGLFVPLGLYFAFVRFWVDSWQRARTQYGVTDQRVLILSGGTSQDTKSIALQSLSDLSLREHANGRGTILFGPSHPRYAAWAGTGWPGLGRKQAPWFDQIEGARAVYELIRDRQGEGTGRAGARPTGLPSLDSRSPRS